MKSSNLSASIVLYNTPEKELNQVIKCIFNSSKYIKLYLIDNSPSDRLRKFSKFHKNIFYIFNKKNIGYGAGHNIAIRKSVKEMHANLDSIIGHD